MAPKPFDVLFNGKDAKLIYIGAMPDGGFKITADESEFLTLIMWEAAADFQFTDDSLIVKLEEDV